MNLIKIFRKPYFAFILASLTLFASCSQYDNELDENSIKLANKIDLANYVEKHLQLSTDITILLESEKNIDVRFLQSVSENQKPQEILGMLENANIQQSDVISELFIKIYNNNLNFVNSNLDLENLNYKEIENMIIAEIDKQLIEYHSKSGSCQSTYSTAKARCNRNLAISMSISAAVGVFTGGMGWGIGAGAALLVGAMCAGDATDDYNACMGY